jgi:hypothetical protein
MHIHGKGTTLQCDSIYKQTCDLYILLFLRSLQLLNLRLVVKLKLQVLFLKLFFFQHSILWRYQHKS